ncbi:hypothetical protein [Microbacterium testaceum]|uniref:hypothetical protein n=1 Tax=Microbacterium testaceum TaxID=2033 RepID=UPI00187BEF59
MYIRDIVGTVRCLGETVPATFELPVAALEREQLIVPDRVQSLSRLGGRADLDPVFETEVVHDVDAWGGELIIHRITDTPFAHGAEPSARPPDTEPGAAEAARRRQHVCDAIA